MFNDIAELAGTDWTPEIIAPIFKKAGLTMKEVKCSLHILAFLHILNYVIYFGLTTHVTSFVSFILNRNPQFDLKTRMHVHLFV